MQDQKKVYGFTLSLYEYIETIPTLWDAVKGVYLVWLSVYRD
jgi:alpha 1,2-mannosyltransferase